MMLKNRMTASGVKYKKLLVAFDWTLDLLFAKDIVQYMVTRAPTISKVETEQVIREDCS
jgi:hypothetical protein